MSREESKGKHSILNDGSLADPQDEGSVLVLENIEQYRDAIKKFREKMIELVVEGTVSEQTASRIIAENEYAFFQQMIAIKYNKK